MPGYFRGRLSFVGSRHVPVLYLLVNPPPDLGARCKTIYLSCDQLVLSSNNLYLSEQLMPKTSHMATVL